MKVDLSGYNYFRPVVKGADAKKLLDIMKWTKAKRPQEAVSNSIDLYWNLLDSSERDKKVKK